MNDLVCLARSGVVVSLALDRPETLNAFDAARVDQLSAALEDGASAGVRLVVPDPPGKGHSGGFDFTGLADHGDGDLALRFLRIELMLRAVHYAVRHPSTGARRPLWRCGRSCRLEHLSDRRPRRTIRVWNSVSASC